jgi:malonyl-CoA O-methyltransferase
MTPSRYDKQRVAQQFSRAAQCYTQHAHLQRQCAELIKAYLPNHCDSLLDVGCGPASHSLELAHRTDFYLGMDIAEGMVRQAQQCQPQLHWLLADAEQLPLQANSISVIVANLALQWCNHLANTLQQCAYALQADGQLLFTTVLEGSMQPLMASMHQLDGQPHHNQFLTVQQLTEQLGQVDQLSWHMELRQFGFDYDSLNTMLAAIKGIGANYTARTTSGYFGKTRWRALAQLMEKHRNEQGKLPLNWNIALIYGRKIKL